MIKKKRKEEVLNEIEELRQQLNALLTTEISISASVLELSEDLDLLISEFYKISSEEKNCK
ncbi:MAG: Spo0E family sporulation regulatory protein-aspartic acid phosphatase [Epulopiscium sp.]|nr:Spo0E family sporulation regulatory protein-aspartic acid phosphatase [Candidatus Epulonipiscium sp.]